MGMDKTIQGKLFQAQIKPWHIWFRLYLCFLSLTVFWVLILFAQWLHPELTIWEYIPIFKFFRLCNNFFVGNLYDPREAPCDKIGYNVTVAFVSYYIPWLWYIHSVFYKKLTTWRVGSTFLENSRFEAQNLLNPISQRVSISLPPRGAGGIWYPPLGNQGRSCFRPHVATGYFETYKKF